MLIAHRGNMHGPCPKWENSLWYIEGAIEAGFQVEIDIRYVNGQFYSGHDIPKYKLPMSVLKLLRPFAWFHLKDGFTATIFAEMFPNFAYFYQDEDCVTVTSTGYIWCNSSNNLFSSRSIILQPEPQKNRKIKMCAGICSDFITSFLWTLD